MEAKDTVMSEEQIIEAMRNAEGYADMLRWRAVIPAQAEISFKAGYEQRGQEIAEWLSKEQRANLRH